MAASAVAPATAGAARFRLASVLVILLFLCGAAHAQSADPALYRARAFVTGEGEAERARGLALCLRIVLVKVSGDPSLLQDPRLKPLEAEAGALVAELAYRDRMAGIPHHDEQGTRERPFDLFVSFDPGKIAAALATLGRAPWPEPRPALALLLGVRDATRSYVLAEDGARGVGERQSLAAIAADHGLKLRLPSERQAAAEHLAFDWLARLAPARAESVAAALGGQAALVGTLAWSEPDHGWKARWRLLWQGRAHRWAIAGVSFDDAFRDAFDHAAAILSGHGG